MKFTKQDLLTMLIGLFLFASCKDSNTIGLDLDSEFEIKGVKMDTTTVTSKTLKDDPASGVGLLRHPLGFLNDDTFGTTNASISMAVGIPGNTYYDFGKDPAIDSAVLVLPYATQFYGDTTTSNFTIKVNQLTNDISKETSYLTSKDWPADDANVLGSYIGKVKPNTKFKVTEIVSGGPDTLKSVIPQIRIPLNKNYIQTHIIELDSITRSTANNFFKSFKGLKVSPTLTAGKGGIMFMDLYGTEGKLEIYYKKQNKTTVTERDTAMVAFPIGRNSGPVTATIKHAYIGDVKTQVEDNNPNSSYNVTYLQALAGLKNKISFPYLKDFLANSKKPENGGTPNTKIIVNKAELVVDLSDGSDALPFSASQRLALYRFDIAGQRANVPDNDNSIQGVYNGDPRALGNELLFGGYFDSVNRRYIFTITSYVQDLLDGKTEDYGTFLAPSSLTEFNISPPVTSASRSVINAYKKNPLSTDKRLRLNIYYTQIN
jgi:hypothetical protein